MVAKDKNIFPQDKSKLTFGEARRRIIIERAKNIVKDKTPIHIETLLSHIEYEQGIRRENAKGILVILHDIGKITIDRQTDMVYWGKRDQIPQGDQGQSDPQT